MRSSRSTTSVMASISWRSASARLRFAATKSAKRPGSSMLTTMTFTSSGTLGTRDTILWNSSTTVRWRASSWTVSSTVSTSGSTRAWR